MDQDAQDIPNFKLDLAEHLAATCPDDRGMGPEFGAPMFACHQSKVGAEFHCAGWLATAGHAHPGVRLNIATGHLDASHLSSQAGWPALHGTYAEVLDKLRRTADPTPTED